MMYLKLMVSLLTCCTLLGCSAIGLDASYGAQNCYGRPQDEECKIVWGGQLPSSSNNK